MLNLMERKVLTILRQLYVYLETYMYANTSQLQTEHSTVRFSCACLPESLLVTHAFILNFQVLDQAIIGSDDEILVPINYLSY